MLILIYILILSFDETIVGVKKKYYLGNLKKKMNHFICMSGFSFSGKIQLLHELLQEIYS